MCSCMNVCVYVCINVCADALGDLVLGMYSTTYGLKLDELKAVKGRSSTLEAEFCRG